VHYELETQHAARQVLGYARVASEEGRTVTRLARLTTGASRAPARPSFLEGRRRWLTAAGAGFWLVKGAEECARCARPITRLIHGRADPARRLQRTSFQVRAAAPAARTLR
jgi:hypothetical protein